MVFEDQAKTHWWKVNGLHLEESLVEESLEKRNLMLHLD